MPRTFPDGTGGGPDTHCTGAGSAFGKTGAAEAPAVIGGTRPATRHDSMTSALAPSKGSGAGRSGTVKFAAWTVVSSSGSATSSSGASMSVGMEAARGAGAAKPCDRTSDEAVSSPTTRTPTRAHRRMLPTLENTPSLVWQRGSQDAARQPAQQSPSPC